MHDRSSIEEGLTGPGSQLDAADKAEEPTPEKSPAAVALGKLGGKKGGAARARQLSARRRSEIARKAARARWDAPPPAPAD